jgi:hypothetical protein
MSPQFSSRLLGGLSACYGVLVGILAILNSSATATVAIIGAMLLGLMWTLRRIFFIPRKPPADSPAEGGRSEPMP